MNKSVFLQTYGCQMNARDSEEVLGMLMAQGYAIAEQPETADVILLNTCSVRQHAEERAVGKMHELSALKRERPEVILGIIGCMAKLRQGEIFERLPQVDLVAGPAELYDVPYLLAEVQERRQQLEAGSWKREAGQNPSSFQPPASSLQNRPGNVIAVGRPYRPLDQRPPGEYRRPGVTAFVTIMEGCDKACTYCIVPKTRGQEISRPAEEIIEEIHRLAEAGYREVTLLGQNVNSYGKRFPDGSGYKGPLGRMRMLQAARAGEPPEIPSAVGITQTARGTGDVPDLLDFPALLRMIDASLRGQTPIGVRPLLRIRFTTSHPFDATERLFQAMAECASVCEWLHLPVQSGSNRILRSMRRGYTAQAYLKKIESLRRLVPDVSLSTDIIVGFPGETEEDVAATERLMREVEYDNAYIFKYSPRPGTDAAAREDDVPQAAKEERNQRLLSLQERVSARRNQTWEGRAVEVLVEGPGKREGQWFGRTRQNHGVVMESTEPLMGRLVPVQIVRTTAHTLFGENLHSKFSVD